MAAIAQPDPNFSKICKLLKEHVSGEAEAVLKGDFSKDKAQTFENTSLSPAEVRKTFTREGLEKEYMDRSAKGLETGGLGVGDIQRLQGQNAVLGAVEKTYRMRHRRRLDFLISGVSRSKALVADTGFITHELTEFPMDGVPKT